MKNTGASDADGCIDGENRSIFSKGKRVLSLHADIGFHDRGFQSSNGPGVGIAERAPYGEAGKLRLKRVANSCRKILEIDGGAILDRGGIQLDFIAGCHSQEADLAGRVSTDMSPTLFRTAKSRSEKIWERMSSEKGRDCGGFSVTRKFPESDRIAKWA